MENQDVGNKNPDPPIAPSMAGLPDPAVAGPYRPFETTEISKTRWWWLYLPPLHAVFVITTFWISTDFYNRWILPEGYGFLEMGHFLVPLAGAIVGLRLVLRTWVRARPLVFWFVVLATFTCLYTSGEEISWGQHFFGWGTPEAWGEINRQNETNLHNTFGIFEKTPRAIIEIGVFGGGIWFPLAARYWPQIRNSRLSLFLPNAVMLPTVLTGFAFKVADEFDRAGYNNLLVGRPSEATETYIYFFMLAYLIVFTAHVDQLETEQKSLK